jgi:hypothetical protein
MKSKRVRKFPFVAPMGKTANFYVPAAKMDDAKYGRDGQTPSQMFESFFVASFGGFTHEESKIQGRWTGGGEIVGDGGGKVFIDQHQRYEVAFAGRRKTAEFFAFLADMCRLLEESSIYVTYGANSWLVGPDCSSEKSDPAQEQSSEMSDPSK